MATWKERGVVPDSDDEEDTLDSQSSIGTGERCDGHLDKGPRDLENGLEQIDQQWSQEEDHTDNNERIARQPLEKAVSSINPDTQADSSHSSPPRPFRDPRIIFDLYDSVESQGPPQSSLPRPTGVVPAEDEISRSYVRLTSPMSSPLSSAPESPVGSSPSQRFQSPEAQRVQIIIDPSMNAETSIPAFESPASYGGRTFRQRNPIQLHPYVVEQEKYRRFLKARGMTPMRIAQAADEYSRKSRDASSSQVSGSQELESQELESQEPESQALESQEFGMDLSQPMDIDWNFAPPSSAPSIGPENRADDGFPDIDELIRDQHALPRQREPKRFKNTYSSKSKRHQLSTVHDQGAQSAYRTSRPESIFDVPASPPRTSSPLLPIPRNIARPASRAMSSSSSVPEDLEEDELAPQNLNDLLTPATSVAKPVPGSALIELDSDSEDPFATEPSVASSSSDEEVEIRKVSKKIRGVLPASHLRLDRHVKKPSATHREFVAVSPVPEPNRRGVALPKTSRASRISSPTTNHGMPFLSEDSDDDDNDVHRPDFVMEDNNSTIPDFHSQRRMGVADEEDKIDAMLPSGKRHAKHQNAQPRKKRRSGDSSLLPKEGRTNPRQIKITEHLTTSRKSNPSKRDKGRHTGGSSRRPHGAASHRPSRVKPPRLGILDVIEIDDQDQEHMPQFIKVAARAARSKRGHGRQSPSKKFIRLASREDTYDAQSVLQDWKNGKLLPRNLERPSREHPEATRRPLNQISDNDQTRFRPPVPKAPSRSQALQGHPRRPRKLIISSTRQSSMNEFVTSEMPRHELSEPIAREPRPQIIRKPPNRHSVLAPQSRPAQLELSEVEYSHRYPTTEFGSRKKALDNLYRVARKRRVPESNIQLSRFLVDEDDNEAPPGTSESTVNTAAPEKSISRSRKRPPQRMDVGAAAFRQPSEPLVLEFLAPREVPDTTDESSRLQGLGKFGTRYTSHFDIFPLQSGVFFHEATFIGSGRLLAILKGPGPSDVSRPCISYRLGEKTSEWGPWNDNVSSDMGVSFDWIVDQLNLQTPAQDDVLGIALLVVNYVQDHLSFTELQHRTIFLSRMITMVTEALDRLKLMSDVLDQSQLQSRIEVVSIWATLVMQLLQISRIQVQEFSMTAKIEELLLATARYCVELLLRKGLESVRKLYDDLQYLSFRTNGIKKDQYAVHSWVVMIKILGAAQIPRGSFWDVTNMLLLDVKVTAMNDARSMEKIWYSIFTLLPLCEFDESGVVIFGQRQTASFDNWALPHKMLKSVFTLYSSSSRQSPSFNDYCRALVSRCHYLMTEWGWWKCNGIIGVIFDFFASQSLGHLRNEEVYKSPHFLDELDTEPSLAVEPDDRCFHIFLKIVALAIKHMRGASEGKGIRNLVFRLLPNHDRQYPKEEALDTRDLASLRNHHDLLCTLYWAAPPDQQPSLTLIQELVVADRSHNAACLINLRAWQQIARFVLTWCTTSEPFQSLLVWQNTFFFKLWGQFNEEDAETRRQAALLGGGLFSETRLRETIIRNKASTMTLLRSSIDAIRCAILSAPSSHAAMVAFNTGIIKSIINMEDSGSGDLTEPLLSDTISVVGAYMDRIQKLHPHVVAPPQSTTPFDDDSQNSLGMDINMDRHMMVFPLFEEVQPCLSKLVRQILECRLYSSGEPRFMKALIERWAQVVSLVTEELSGLKEFLPGGKSAVFIQRRGCDRANKYWPLFLGELLRYKTVDDLETAGVDTGLEWMLALTMPLSEPAHLNRLTLSMHEKTHPLVRPIRDMEAVLRSPSFAGSWFIRHLIQGAIDSMREIYKGSSQSLSWHPQASHMAPQRDFSHILKGVLDSMQHELESMVPRSPLHEQYMTFCQGVAEDIRSRGSEITPLTDFFMTPSLSYWPEEGDPKLFAAGIISYSLRLREHPGRTSSELVHYLYRGWRSDLIHGRLKNHGRYVKKGLKHWSFAEFALMTFVPAVLEVGFNSEFGWILCSTYLPPLADRITRLLERDKSEGMATAKHLSTILKIITNGCMKQYSRWQSSIKGMNPLHRGIVAAVCQFWLALVPAIKCHIDRHPGDSMVLDQANNALATFTQRTVRTFSGTYEGSLEGDLFDIIDGPHVKEAASMMLNDVNRNWTLSQSTDVAMEEKTGLLSIGGFGTRDPDKTGVNLEKLWTRPLGEVLEIGRPFFETGSPCPLAVDQYGVPTEPQRYLTTLFF